MIKNLLGLTLGVLSYKATFKILKKLSPNDSLTKRVIYSATPIAITGVVSKTVLDENAGLYVCSGALGGGAFDYFFSQANAENLKLLKSNLSLSSLKSIDEPQLMKLVVDKYNLENGEKIRFFWNSEIEDDSIDDWYPASTVKYLASAGALQRLSELGFDSRNTEITFHYKGGRNKVSLPFSKILDDGIIKSDNIAYNQLVQIAGHKRLHDTILKDYDLALSKPYLKDRWQNLTGSRHFDAPKITVRQGETVKTLEPSSHQSPRFCPDRSSCARLSGFTDSMFDLVMTNKHGLSTENKEELLRVLSSPKPRGNTFLDAILSQITNYNFVVYNKPGFAINYYSDSILLVDPSKKVAFAISAVGYEGRNSLTNLGTALGELINSGAF